MKIKKSQDNNGTTKSRIIRISNEDDAKLYQLYGEAIRNGTKITMAEFVRKLFIDEIHKQSASLAKQSLPTMITTATNEIPPLPTMIKTIKAQAQQRQSIIKPEIAKDDRTLSIELETAEINKQNGYIAADEALSALQF